MGSQFEFFCDTGSLPEGILRYQNFTNSECTYEDIKNNFTVMAPFAHPSLVFRREAFALLGGYDENYDAAEDYEIVGRLITRGYKVYKIPEVLVRCRFTPKKGISQEKREVQIKTALKIKLEFILNNVMNHHLIHNMVIWGIREFAGYLADELREPKYKVNVKCFTDFDESTWGTIKNNLPVVSPEEMIKNLDGNDIVISMWNIEREEIVSFLEENHLKRNENFFVFS